MITKLLATTGTGEFVETDWTVPEVEPSGIIVKSVMTGVCRSDIDMMEGNFGPLPESMQGHEGLGQVIEIGSEVTDVRVGDYVATRGEPAYADVYPVRAREYVYVPEANPKYILEPVACGVNLIMQPIEEIRKRQGFGKRLLLLGSGFLAWVAYHTIKSNNLQFDITVVGKSNKELWSNTLSEEYSGEYDVVIDINSSTDVFTKPIVKPEALVVLGTQKQITTDFANLLWKACTIVFPSPRTAGFYQCMKIAEFMVSSGYLKIDKFWTQAYNRKTQWQQAFADGANRPKGYSRGYLVWD
jgi:D-arabinose 1-dehydrogenase-like Zn-dependent alcohol dehydrogenase